ncbi:SigE family RNA polymerase sigma factor [Promicromonospora sukumoe]|uniref:RNA polymerase sigma-70 factor (Sigma-E family) n=1 Tax=Promicromonospora sukumoe TaxID=88382 RepID=A0A7W3J7H5_9MICO|nr:SigE family RNA polymerase sigma factor [Promicromonospora sukumoe]MBA8807726.1 RNA polymerase sigma-70 factor (sigma-E family) [Promicromonospora sukumoe]
MARDVSVEVPRTRDAEFTEFVRDSSAYLHRTAYLLCGDRHRAEELVQSTFERVYRTWAKVKPGTERAYARRILVNLRIDAWRHAHRESFPGDDNIPIPPTSDHAGHVVLRDELVRGLARLPLNQRRVVVLRHLLDLPEAEVARELGIAVGTVKAANSRGLARLRDLLVAQAEVVEPVVVDEKAVLDRSRAALRRRRTRQAVGTVCVAVLLVLGVLTRGPVTLPWVGPVVLPGGELIARLLDGRIPGPDLDPTGNAPVVCPEELPGPTPTRAPEAGEDVGPLRDPVVVDAADARSLSCYDVDVEPSTPGYRDQSGVPVSADGESLPEPRGLTDAGLLWQFGENRETGSPSIVQNSWALGTSSSSSSLTSYQGATVTPTDLTVTGNRVVWSEYAAKNTSPRASFVRTLIDSRGFLTTVVDPLATTEERLWLIATTREHALWTAGPTADDTRLFATTLDGDGTPAELAAGVTALAADEDEVIAAVRNPGGGGTSTTTIRVFDDLTGADVTGTVLVEIEHDPSAEVAAAAVSDDVVAWTVVPADARTGGTLYALDRTGDGDSVVRLDGGVVDDLRASGSLLSWTSTDTASDNPADTSYLYRATASASGYDGPDLARYPGGSVAASLSGERTAWLEDAGARQWLVEAAVVPTLGRD